MEAHAAAAIDPPVAAHPVRTAYALDDGPARHRIGIIALANDFAVERDFAMICPAERVSIHVSRVLNDNSCTVETLFEMAPKLTESASLIAREAELGALVYGCTSGTVVIGYDEVAARLNEAHPGVPVVTPITAGLAALDRFDARRIAVLTPYVDDVNGPIVRYIEDRGLEVLALTSFLLEDGRDMARIPPDAIHAAALEADRPQADALFISCTAIRAVDVVDRIEQALGKPVVTANQALAWQALRYAGYQDPIDGYGELFRLPGT